MPLDHPGQTVKPLGFDRYFFMKKIPLTKGYEAIVDDEDYDSLSKFNWSVNQTKERKYAVRITTKNYKQTAVMMHRTVMNPPEKMVVDHINRDSLDNRKENLRICTRKENSVNRCASKGSMSKYLGVSKDKDKDNGKKRWRARLQNGDKNFTSKRFYTEEEAALAYNEMAIMHHGKFASLNIISSD